jgi:DNA-binding XRE family transcriptional regulator
MSWAQSNKFPGSKPRSEIMNTKIDANLLRVLRKNRNWSQEELAQVSGVSPRTVQRIENGADASYETKRAFALAFNIEPADLDMRDETHNENLRRGRMWGIAGTTVGFVCAFIAVSYSLFAGHTTGLMAGATLGVLGTLSGLICALINWQYQRRLNAA